MIKEIKLIFSDEEKIGKGITGDPVRRIIKLVSLDGDIILKHDPEKKTALNDNNLYKLL